MPYWNNVLVYADGRPDSEHALAEALRLVESTGGRATVLDVLHNLPARIPTGLLAMDQAELLGLMIEQRREQLDEDVERLRVSSRVSVRVTHGSPAFELVRQAVRGKHDLIVKAARGRDVKHMTSFGSTALHLVRKSPVPVMLMSPNRALLEAPKVLCALELDDLNARQELNLSLLRASANLAASYGAELHVVHVHDAPAASVYRAFLSSELFERFCRERQDLLGEQLMALLASELPGVARVHAHLLDGDPSDTVVHFVETQRVSHLVMGSVARQERGFMLGSLAEDVLTRVDCSVLTLKPAGFESPIQIDVPSAA
jgi:nucleotide-binding universal stress UspA family protein